jgi:Tol biopolymer transport system component
MSRLLAAIGLVLVLTGCSGANTPSERPPQADATTSSPSVSTLPPTPSPTQIATELPGRQGVVAYSMCPGGNACRIWVVNDDGSGARELLPDEPGEQRPLAWSADGSQLYYYFAWYGLGPADGRSGLAMTDAIGSRSRVLFDAGSPASADGEWCPEPYVDDNCGLGDEGRLAVSPDGTRLAYAVVEGASLNLSTIVVLDISSGALLRLTSTRTRNPRTLPEGEVRGGNGMEPCTAAHRGYNGALQWSPDGTALVFTRLGCHSAIFTVDADGTDLQELAPLRSEFDGLVRPRWSPDGSSIVFSAMTPFLDEEGFLDSTTVDIYTVRADGTGFQAPTSDGVSFSPFWTRDGRIVFIRSSATTDRRRGDLWIMDADGGHASQLQATVPALTAAGCVVCPYPINADPDPRGPNQFFGQPFDLGRNVRLWQPVREGQP